MAVTLDDIKKLSPQKKALAILLVYLLLGYFYYFFLMQSSLEKKGTLDTKLAELDEQVQAKERIASKKDQYVRELNAMKEAFAVALTKLPEQKEIPGLLYAVAMAGKSVGMDFVLFEPTQKKPEVKAQTSAPTQPGQKAPASEPKKGDAKGGKDSPDTDKFYEEIPVKVVVNGGFHETALFFDRVAKLPRIVNIEDIAMGERKEVKGRGRVITTACVIKTYMFMEKKTDQEKKADGKKPDAKK